MLLLRLSPVVNMCCIILPVLCQQFKRVQFVFLSASISVTLLRVMRSDFIAWVSKGLKCTRISGADYESVVMDGDAGV